ncbi:putative bZIP transcription factor protein [Trachipleistophora hominis]|uniref:Putative bZIP transcription factor protein n=1 Tax=Trachipleistophora hominis TaxID=72359 RepID=L7JXX7_TRAHO|nr:putative bZIP transcription factor protein [Trachipleistophora hominis]
MLKKEKLKFTKYSGKMMSHPNNISPNDISSMRKKESAQKMTYDDATRINLANVGQHKVDIVQDGVPNTYDMDIFYMKSIWKKERNRLAAKKSREKKAKLMKEYELNEKKSIQEIMLLKQAIYDYDNILKEFFVYIENVLNDNNVHGDNLVALFDFLCRLKKPGKDYYIENVSSCMERSLMVTNNQIYTLTIKIRSRLNEMWNQRRR